MSPAVGPAVGTVLAISRVELIRMLRERSNLFFVFVLPLLLVVFIGLQFGGTAGTPVGVVGDGAATDELVERLDDEGGVNVTRVDDADELEDLVSRGNLGGGVVVGEGYGAALAAAEPFTIGFVARPDSASMSLRTVVEAAVAEHAAASQAARHVADVTGLEASTLVDLADDVRGEVATVTVTAAEVGGDALAEEFAGLGQFDLGASGQLFLFVFLTSLAGSAALIQTRQYGVAARMMSTPAPTPVVLAGLAGGRLAVALFQALYIIVVTTVGFDVDWGDPLATGVLVLLFCVVAAAAGMLLGSVARNDAQASGAGVGIALVAAALGGSMMPLEFFPEGMRQIALLTPHGWANTAMAEIVRRDGGVADVAVELGVLAAIAVVLTALATVTLRRAIVR